MARYVDSDPRREPRRSITSLAQNGVAPILVKILTDSRTDWNKGIDSPPPSYATMYRTKQHKLSVYHGNDYGELYDLENDPDEHNNLWENPDAQNLKTQLIKDSFDTSTIIHDPGSTRIGRF